MSETPAKPDSSQLKLKCPHCEGTVTTPKANYGKTIQCPACAGEVIVPQKPEGPKVASFIDDDEMPGIPGSGAEGAASSGGPTQPGAEVGAGAKGSSGGEVDDEEPTIFEASPVKGGFFTWWLLGILLFPILVGIYFLVKIWLITKYTSYRLNTERFLLSEGFLSRRDEEIEIFRIKDVNATQSFWERIFKTGTVTIWSTDDSTPKVVMPGMRNPVEVKETIRREARRARKREGVRGAEFIQS